MLKKSILILFVGTAASLASCKKQYSCECASKVTWSAGGSSGSKEVVHKEMFTEKMKEKTATSACSAVETQAKKHVEEQIKDAYNGTGISPSISTSCKLM